MLQCPVHGLCVRGVPVAAEMCLFSEDTADVLRDRMPPCLQSLLSSGSENTCTYVHTSSHIHTTVVTRHTCISGEGENGEENLLPNLGGEYARVNHGTLPTCLCLTFFTIKSWDKNSIKMFESSTCALVGTCPWRTGGHFFILDTPFFIQQLKARFA